MSQPAAVGKGLRGKSPHAVLFLCVLCVLWFSPHAVLFRVVRGLLHMQSFSVWSVDSFTCSPFLVYLVYFVVSHPHVQYFSAWSVGNDGARRLAVML